MVTWAARAIVDKIPLAARIQRLVRDLARHHAPRAASAMAFDAFLSLVPLLAFAGWLLDRLHQRGDVVLRSLLATAPPAIATLAGREFFRLSEKGAAAIPPISITAFLWVSSGGLATAIAVSERIFSCEPRSYWHRRALALACVVAALAGIAGLAALVGAASMVGPAVTAATALVVPPVATVSMVAGFFRVAIRRPRSVRRRVIPGALVTVLLWVIVSTAFSAYVASFARYATLYGNLATVAVVMAWLWLLALALLVGGEVNAQLEGVRDDAVAA